MPTVYLALGSNLGDRAVNLLRALEALPPVFNVEARSPVYETEPMYVETQPQFLNQVCRAQTPLLPLEALECLKLVETDLGRESTFRFGPRLIDLDLLFYEDLIFDTPILTLPHPRLHERAFVLVPLNDLAPGLIHPKFQLTISELLARLPEEEKSKVWKKDASTNDPGFSEYR
jgi:2-amino-4-hydroxy-6-hydroxymethyldihydropteridine diphosphokinase